MRANIIHEETGSQRSLVNKREARQPERMMGNRHPLKAAKIGQITGGRDRAGKRRGKGGGGGGGTFSHG